MPDVIKDECTIIIRNVRLAFPDLREAVQFQGTGPFSYKATFLVTPGSDADKLILTTVQKAAAKKWADPTKAAAFLTQAKASGSQKFCYVDGVTKAYDGFAGNMALSTSRPKDSGMPLLIGPGGKDDVLSPESGKPYGGCYVNAKVTIWAQDNEYGKAIRATLVTVQFVKDGDSFGGAAPATADGMEAIEGADDLM